MTADFRRYEHRIKKTYAKQNTSKHLRANKQHHNDQTIGLATYNVRGLATNIHRIGERLQGVKEVHERGRRDIVFLQETHLNPGEHQQATNHTRPCGDISIPRQAVCPTGRQEKEGGQG